MYLDRKIVYLYTESPLHAGTGAGLGAVDMPIQRERITGYPIIQSGGIKGAFRSANTGEKNDIKAAFGPDADEENPIDYGGALSFGDARILLFPIRSLNGVFAWTTSLNVLQRWQRETGVTGLLPSDEPPTIPGNNTMSCYACQGVSYDNSVVLEEYRFEVSPEYDPSNLAGELAKYLPDYLCSYWGNRLKQNLVILRDEDFSIFVQQTTEVITRIRLFRETKTVVPGALWTEEHLPMDTLMYLPVRSSKLHGDIECIWKQIKEPETQAKSILSWLVENTPEMMQIGGDETIGHGYVSLFWKDRNGEEKGEQAG